MSIRSHLLNFTSPFMPYQAPPAPLEYSFTSRSSGDSRHRKPDIVLHDRFIERLSAFGALPHTQ